MKKILLTILGCIFCLPAFANPFQSSSRDQIISNHLDQMEKQFSFSSKRPPDMKIAKAASSSSMKINGNYSTKEFHITHKPNDPLVESKNVSHQFEFALDTYYFTYIEPHFIKDKGYMYGLNAAYTRRIKKDKASGFFYEGMPNVLKIDTRFDWGYIDYEGTGNVENIRDLVSETRLTLGDDIYFKNVLFTPYAGFGYRYLNDGFSKDGRVAGGYDRESNYFYLPLGLTAHKDFKAGYSIEANAEYDYFLFGRQKSHLENISASYETLDNKQNKGFGLRGSLKFIKQNEKVAYFLEPFIRYWKIEDSEVEPEIFNGTVIGFGLEPNNNTTEYGLKLGASF
jgi:hypothetical protein